MIFFLARNVAQSSKGLEDQLQSIACACLGVNVVEINLYGPGGYSHGLGDGAGLTDAAKEQLHNLGLSLREIQFLSQACFLSLCELHQTLTLDLGAMLWAIVMTAMATKGRPPLASVYPLCPCSAPPAVLFTTISYRDFSRASTG